MVGFQKDLFDVCKNKHNGADTSAAAFNSTTTDSRYKQRVSVMTVFHDTRRWYGVDPGCTCDEVEKITGIPHQSASARITELVIEGKLRDTGVRRKTRTGRTARVYVAVQG